MLPTYFLDYTAEAFLKKTLLLILKITFTKYNFDFLWSRPKPQTTLVSGFDSRSSDGGDR